MSKKIKLDETSLLQLSEFNQNQIRWTPQNLLEFQLILPRVETVIGEEPEVTQIHYIEERLQLINILRSIGVSDDYIDNAVRNNKEYIVIEGEWARQIAIALRDKYKVNFPGSANIPSGPAKG